MFKRKKKSFKDILNEEQEASDILNKAEALVWLRQLENVSDDLLTEIVYLINKRLYQY